MPPTLPRTRTDNSLAGLLVVTQPQACRPELAIAALQAGAAGLLDLGTGGEDAPRRRALAVLEQSAAGRDNWGVAWDLLGQSSRFPRVLQPLAKVRWPILLLADIDFAAHDLSVLLAQARDLAAHVLAEVYSLADADQAAAAGFDGVVLKGLEAGGRAGRQSVFLLLQQARRRLEIPFWARGGMSPQTAAAAVVAGGRGVVLSEPLWLADESPLDTTERASCAQLDGSETVWVGDQDRGYRFFQRAARTKLAELAGLQAAGQDWLSPLREMRLQDVSPVPSTPAERLIPAGEEVALAGPLARCYGTVARIVAAYRHAMDEYPRLARQQRALAPDGPLARRHKTKYPIVQGPMTRVSNVVPFCDAVSRHGGLPCLALALTRQPELDELLQAAREQMGQRSWAVGLLGFVSAELRAEQFAAVCRAQPPLAVIAGGRPGQAAELERHGIASYLHVPSPGLLEMFIREGGRRFVFEGRECGGHVGPRHSFTLWGQAIDVLLQAGVDDPAEFQLLFAGGIHDRLSAAMVAAVAAPLVARGMQIGVLVGTAYLFTPEAVATGAITAEFQRQALACRETALLESGVGHATRCAATPFAAEFQARKRELIRSGAGAEQVRDELEMLNLGRLRIAAKGVTRGAAGPDSERDGLIALSEDDVRREGLFMIGDVATQIDRLQPLGELHADLSAGSVEVLESIGEPAGLQPAASLPLRVSEDRPGREPLAVIGMECLFPGSEDLRTFWQNILRRCSAVREVPPERWSVDTYFTSDRQNTNGMYSKWGAFLGEIPFDPFKYRMPPASLPSIEPAQLLSLELAWRALENAGCFARGFAKDRTAVIFAIAGQHDLGAAYGFRTMLRQYLSHASELTPETRAQVLAAVQRQLPTWTEDSFPGVLLNVISGRISNQLDLGGPNFVVDAACASSLAALHIAAAQLRDRQCDVALIGSVDATNGPAGFMSFSRTQALSPRGQSCPFDDSADGIVLGEGVAAVVLKRLADAQRDGDRIYAVVRGVGTSSDGRNCSLTAPNPAGQKAALVRAYADAGLSPATVSLVEAHGTSTTLGDRVELETLQQFLSEAGAARHSCGVGSVKSMIGHAKGAAGMAGLIKAVMALHEKILPPTINVQTPNRNVDFANGPLYVNAETRPWLRAQPDCPRRAGLSAFGFGGTNFHAVLEEAPPSAMPADRLTPRAGEVFFWAGRDRQQLGEDLRRFEQQLAPAPAVDLAQLAGALYQDHVRRASIGGTGPCRLAIAASSLNELREGLQTALTALDQGVTSLAERRGVYLETDRDPRDNRVCFLMPGQGAQHVNMLKDLLLLEPDALASFEQADQWTAGFFERRLSSYIYPPPAFRDEERARQKTELDDTRVAQPALSAVALLALRLMRRFGLRPDFVAGHSHGEYLALHVAGCLSEQDLVRLSALRGRAVERVCRDNPGGMAAVFADPDVTAAALQWLELPLQIANYNAPDHTIIAGSVADLSRAIEELPKHKKLRVRRIPVTAAFHTPAVQGAVEELAPHLETIDFQPPQIPVFCNATAQPYPSGAAAIRRLIARHFVEPVQFVQQIEALFEAGARVFVEVGPGSILTNYVGRILEGRPHALLTLDVSGRDGSLQLAHVLARAAALGLPVNLDAWFAGRGLPTVTTAELFAAQEQRRTAEQRCWRVGPTWVKPPGAAPLPAAAPAPVAPPTVTAGTQPSSPVLQNVAESRGQPPAGGEPAASRVPVSTGAAVRTVATSPRGDARQVTFFPELTGSTMETTLPQLAKPGPKAAAPAQRLAAATGPSAAAAAPAPEADCLPACAPAVNQRPARLPADAYEQFQANMARWLDLQEQVQRSAERFLDVQEQGLRLVTGTAPPEVPAAFPPASLAGPHHAVVPALEPAGLPEAVPVVTPAVETRATPAEPLTGPAAWAGSAVSEPLFTLPRNVPGRRVAPAPVVGQAAVLDLPASQPCLAVAAPAQVPTTADFRRDLLADASRRTGYPVEMLRDDLLLEADLGIDSIKKIEILSGLKQTYMQVITSGNQREEELLNGFAGMKTVRDIVGAFDRARSEFLAKQSGGDPSAPAASAVAELESPAGGPGRPFRGQVAPDSPSPNSTPSEVTRPAPSVPVQRCVVRPVRKSLPEDGQETAPVPEGRAVMVLGELPGAETLLAEQLLPSLDFPVFTVLPGADTGPAAERRYTCSLESPDALRRLHTQLQADGFQVGAVINLLGLREPFATVGAVDPNAALQLTTWVANVAREFEGELRDSAQAGGARFLNVTTMNGRFGFEADGPLPLAQAGTVGLMKGLRQEWPHVLVKNIDVDPQADPQATLLALLAEMLAADRTAEVGLDGAGRWVLDVVEEPLPAGERRPLDLDEHAVVLLTGGGRGLTADVAQALAARYRCQLILVGRSSPSNPEDPQLRSLADAAALKRYFLGQAGPAAVPAEIERQVRQVCEQREARANLAALRQTGARVEYHACDVRDTARFGGLIDDIYRRHGRLDGVVYGAGVIEDRRLADKTVESLARVFRTKADGAGVLAARLRPESLKFLVFFSSVAARFGNAHQADYCAANEYLNKLAQQLDARWPARVVSINWGLWDRDGMVSPHVRQRMAELDIALMPPSAGVRAFLDQLEAGPRHAAEVLLGCSLTRMHALTREGVL